MSKHYYLLIETTDANLSKGMRQLNGVNTQPTTEHMHEWGMFFQ
jgi:hypothetical protein